MMTLPRRDGIIVYYRRTSVIYPAHNNGVPCLHQPAPSLGGFRPRFAYPTPAPPPSYNPSPGHLYQYADNPGVGLLLLSIASCYHIQTSAQTHIIEKGYKETTQSLQTR